jgi:aminopeptidase N
VIGSYGVNNQGSGDMYPKGANLIHTIRQVIDNDKRFKDILRGLNKIYYHSTVNSADVEVYFSKHSGKKLGRIFDQYLRTTRIPVLEYKISGTTLSYRWANCVSGFDMPVRFFSQGSPRWLKPAAKWQTLELGKGRPENSFSIDRNFYIQTRQLR